LFLVEEAVVGVLADGSIVRWTGNDPAVETLASPTARALESASLAPDRSRVVAIDRSGMITTVRLDGTGSGGAVGDPTRLDDFAIGEVTNVDIDDSSDRIVASTTTGDVVVLDRRLSVLSRFPAATGRIGALAFVPESASIITGLNERTGTLSFDDTVAAWEPASGQASYRIGGESEDVVGCSSFYSRVAFLDGGATMAMTSHDFTVVLADTSTGEELFRFEPEGSTLLDIATTPDGSRLIVSSDLGTYTVWNLADRTKMGTFQALQGGYQALATLPDNRTMATTTLAGDFGLVDIETGERLVELEVINRGVRRPGAIAVSADGSLLATPIAGDAVGIWSTATGQRLATLVGHTSAVTDVDIAPDLTYLVTSSSDGTIRTWMIDISTG
jgi:WD40 repeat protein